MAYANREAWLHALADRLNPLFAAQGYALPPLRIACGFPSKRAMTGCKNQRIGECWSGEASADGTVEVMISPVVADPMATAAILAHELVHAAVGNKYGHKGPFRTVALALGLEGRMTATVAGEAFKRSVQPMLDQLGPYPHASLDARGQSSGPKKQGTRLIKVMCPMCEYSVRVTRTWLDLGAPICPLHNASMEEE